MKGHRDLAWLRIGMVAAFLVTANAVAAPDDVPLKTSNSTDATDLWWNPNESGWGLQMVHTGSFIYATIYVYGPDGKPTWFGGGLNAAGGTTWTGTLYVTAGPYFGGVFNPASVTVRSAGTMTFTGITTSTGTFTYTVDGVTVTKAIQRQPLTLDNYNGGFLTVITGTATGCINPAGNVTGTNTIAITTTQNGTAMSQVWRYSTGVVCTYNGTYSQRGRMGQFDSNYSCTSGEVGVSRLFEMNNAPNMFTARWVSNSTNLGCTSTAELSGVIPR